MLSRKLQLCSTAEDLFQTLFADEPYAFWLDSSRHQKGEARFSFLGATNGPESYRVDSFVNGGTKLLRTDGHVEAIDRDIFRFLEQRLASLAVETDRPLPFDFHGGFLGYLGYELMAVTEGVSGHGSMMPDASLLFIDRFLAIDHNTDELYLVALHTGELESAKAWLALVEATLGRLSAGHRAGIKRPTRLLTPAKIEPYLLYDRDAYLQRIARAKQMILAGETYEICLTNRVRVPLADSRPDTLLAAYLALRQINPAPYASFLRLGSVSVLSSSPERFLKITSDGKVETKPIKGTMRRSADSKEDEANRQHLLTSEQYFSEHLMIVDLLRNDLTRSCVPGSVHVPALMEVESYATVHQLVSTIRGTLEQSPVRCIANCFPGGSMTGAPKKRTLEIINDLEDAPRGIYSGAIGYLSLNGAVDLSIVIRTVVVQDTLAEIGVGGAIIHLSEPEEEYQEMLLKAFAPFSAIAPLAAVESASREEQPAQVNA
jgi:para-aminobenzoate synthetase